MTMISAPAAGRARKRWAGDSCRSRSDPGAAGVAVVVVAIDPSRSATEGPALAGPPAKRPSGADRGSAQALGRERDHVRGVLLGDETGAGHDQPLAVARGQV